MQDWNVFVSDKSFEEGLLWLERRVALKQAQLRGFFTYSDLAASCSAALAGELLRAAAAAALAYAAGLLALLTSTLVVSHTWLPALQYIAARGSVSTTVDSQLSRSYQDAVAITTDLSNATVEMQLYTTEDTVIDNLRCCDKWTKYHEYQELKMPKRTWYDCVVTHDWTFEPWWSKTSVLNWLYQSSLISPVQRWLEKMNQYIEFFSKEFGYINLKSTERCNGYSGTGERRCVRQWLNLSKVSVFVASLSDR